MQSVKKIKLEIENDAHLIKSLNSKNKQRDIFILQEILGGEKTYQEIADNLNITKQRIASIICNLKKNNIIEKVNEKTIIYKLVEEKKQKQSVVFYSPLTDEEVAVKEIIKKNNSLNIDTNINEIM